MLTQQREGRSPIQIDYLLLLQATGLFAGIPADQLPSLVAALRPARRVCGKGEFLVQYGQGCTHLGVLLSGRLEAWRPLPGGGRIPAAAMQPGGVFGDVLAGAGLKSPVNVQMETAGEVLLFPYEALLAPCPDYPAAHTRLLHNLVGTMGRKYFALMDRVELLTLKSLRVKLAAYLLGQADRAGADTFSVPYTRAALAEYLGCERSALSRELSRMQADGLIQTYKSSFKLTDRPGLEQLYQI